MSYSLRLLLLSWLALGPALAWAQATAPASLAKTLRASKWQRRLVLVCAPTADDVEFKQQKSVLSKDPTGLQERDIQVVALVATELSAADKQYLQQQLSVTPGTFTVLLLGKDGGVKLHQTKLLTTRQLFSTIDTMPMRQQEMRKKH